MTGYLTAVEAAAAVLQCAHTEAHSVENGIAIVKLMGRDAANFTLVPEVPFRLGAPRGFLAALKERFLRRGHALIVVAEGAGQEFLQDASATRDASGNVKLQDIGPFLRESIESYFRAQQIRVTLRYIDPSYTIRSIPADAADAVLCDLFARNGVHAAMAGKTGLVIGLIHDQFVHVPIEVLTAHKKRMDPAGMHWRAAH